MRRNRGARILALVSAVGLLAAACGDDDDDSGAEETTATTAAGGTETTAAGGTETTAAASTAPMVLTIDINPDAVWDDGSPITVADFECTWKAYLNTPGSVITSGYDKVTAVKPGTSDKQVVVEFSQVYAAYKGLFSSSNGPIIKAASVENCEDVSADFQTELPFSARPYKIDSFSENQMVWVANEAYWGENKPNVERVVVVGFADSDTEIAAIKSGEVDFIYPQFFTGIEDALADPNIQLGVTYGGDYEGLYFQQDDGRGGIFSDDVFRQAFALSVDRDGWFQQIYAPLGGADAEMLQCGPIIPGPYCDDAFTSITYDPDAAAALLTENGWAKNGDGLWAKDGEVPEIKFMVNSGNTRRESSQAYLIPKFRELGFNVVADNCEALPCVFQQRLPALDYDLTMYISTAPPDPGYLVQSFTCEQIPTDENGQQGFNNTGWCNEEGSKALNDSDAEVDEAARAELIKFGLEKMAEDFMFLPMFQFPKSGAWRTDKVGGNIEGDLTNYMAFRNVFEWEDLDGDGQIIIGAEQFPGCLNPVTECASSSWYQWVAGFVVLPSVWDTTNDATYETTDLVVGEPVVTVNG